MVWNRPNTALSSSKEWIESSHNNHIKEYIEHYSIPDHNVTLNVFNV